MGCGWDGLRCVMSGMGYRRAACSALLYPGLLIRRVGVWLPSGATQPGRGQSAAIGCVAMRQGWTRPAAAVASELLWTWAPVASPVPFPFPAQQSAAPLVAAGDHSAGWRAGATLLRNTLMPSHSNPS